VFFSPADVQDNWVVYAGTGPVAVARSGLDAQASDAVRVRRSRRHDGRPGFDAWALPSARLDTPRPVMPNAPTDIPVNVDGTYREPTWGEGGSFDPSGHEANGAGAGVMIGANDFNEPRRHAARWIRAMITRSVPSDAGLFGSFLLPGSGGWNVSGGTLNGTLGASWVLVDADDDGGVVIQYNVTAGSPHVFTASRDTYVDLAEDGTATYTAVANGAPEPAVAASSVRVWKVVTDGTEITSATTVLPEIPVFKDIAANSLALTDLLAVGGDLDVTGNLTVGGDSALGDDAGDSHTITGSVAVTGDTAITGSLTVAADNPANFTGDVTLGSDSADAITVNGTTTFNAPVTIANGQAFVANGNSTIGNAGTDTLTCNAAATFGTTVVANGAISALAGINLSAQTISGSAGSLVSVENVALLEQRWTDSVGTLPGTAGEIRWNGTFFSYRDQTNVARTLDEPVRGHDATFTTDQAIVDTDAVAVRRVQASESVWIEISCRYEADGAEEMAYRIQVDGPLGTATILSDDVTIAAANKGYPFFQALPWTPTDDFAETDPQNYTFTVGLGIGGAPTLTATNVTIKVSSNLQI
jgi:hypothetical protein